MSDCERCEALVKAAEEAFEAITAYFDCPRDGSQMLRNLSEALRRGMEEAFVAWERAKALP